VKPHIAFVKRIPQYTCDDALRPFIVAFFVIKVLSEIFLLVKSVDDGEYSTCLYSKKKNLIDLVKDSLKNEIELISLTKRGDEQ
jgi:hypothetical protein